MAKKLKNKNRACIKLGCEDWELRLLRGEACPDCDTCGFNAAEAERRKQIPLVLGEDGLLRKYIRRDAE